MLILLHAFKYAASYFRTFAKYRSRGVVCNQQPKDGMACWRDSALSLGGVRMQMQKKTSCLRLLLACSRLLL